MNRLGYNRGLLDRHENEVPGLAGAFKTARGIRMFGKTKKTSQSISIKNLETIIGRSVRIDGDIQVTSGIRIDGVLNGNILAEDGHSATVAIAEGASVKGNVRAGHIIISGEIVGNVTADRLEVLHTAHIQGDLSYKSVRIESGARIFGLLNQTEHRAAEEKTGSLSILRSEEDKKSAAA